MESPTKNRRLIVLLLILNLIAMALLWFGQFRKPAPPPQPGTQESLIEGAQFLKKELNLSKDQIQLFIQSRNRQAESSRAVQSKIHQLKKQILDETFKAAPDSLKVQALSNEIGRHQAEFERDLFRHFTDLKSYCSPEQQAKLISILYDMALKSRPPKPGVPRLQ